MRPSAVVVAVALCCGSLFAFGAQAATLKGVRMHEAPDSTRVVFDIDASIQYNVFTLDNPRRVVVDLKNVRPQAGFDPAHVALGRKRVGKLRAANRDNDYRVVIDVSQKLEPKAFTLRPIKPYGHRLVVDLFDTTNPRPKPVLPPPRDRDVVIAIDAGHGGDDPGAIGPKRTPGRLL